MSGETWLGLGLSAAGAALVLVTGQGTLAGAFAGFLGSALIVTGLGVGAFAPLAVFVLGSGALTRLGRAAKEARGLGEANRGRRSVANVAAKLALPALCGVLGLLRPDARDSMALVFVAALCGAFADTAGTEVGPLGGGKVLVLERGRIAAGRHGAPGGVSALGLGAGAVAAVATAAAAWLPGVIPSGRAAAAAAAAGVGASVVESGLAGTAIGLRLGHHGRNAAVSVLSAAGMLAARSLGWA